MDQNLGDPLEDVDENLQRSLAQTLRFGTPPPTLGISPMTTKLMFGLSRSLENMSFDPLSSRLETRPDLGLGYTNKEFYLPMAGCPSVSELEPQLTDKLTLKGNRAKLLHVPLWNDTYYTSMYLTDNVTREIYACHQDEIIAIKEQGYLQKEMAEEKYLEDQIGKIGVESNRQEHQQKEALTTEKTPKVLLTVKRDVKLKRDSEQWIHRELSEQNKKVIEEATSMLHEQEGEAHQQVVMQWNAKRCERKQLERDLLKYQVSTVKEGFPTDQEIEQARAYIASEHTKQLKEELPYINQYFETIPMEMEVEDNDGLSESSAGSYEAREKWDEKEYQKLIINFNRNQAQYAIDRQVKELAIQRDPESASAIEREYSENIE